MGITCMNLLSGQKSHPKSLGELRVTRQLPVPDTRKRYAHENEPRQWQFVLRCFCSQKNPVANYARKSHNICTSPAQAFDGKAEIEEEGDLGDT